MNRLGPLLKKTVVVVVGTVLLLVVALPAKAELILTEEEKEYVAGQTVLKAVSLNGGAPYQYMDGKGNVRGISRLVLERISDMTGLHFEYRLYDSMKEIEGQSSDLGFGISTAYPVPGIVLTRPYIRSETVLFVHSSMDAGHLEGKRYAGVAGSTLPDEIDEKTVLYFNTREESLNAVEKGKADYGYGDAYVISYYTLRNGYKNIITIPKGLETRAYCLGVPEDNPILISILDKAIADINESEMMMYLLNAMTRVERKVTLAAIMDTYGQEILAVVIVLLMAILFGLIMNIRSGKKLHLQNRKYELLSHISNEYLYDYMPKTGELVLSEKCLGLFENPDMIKTAVETLKETLLNKMPNDNGDVVRLALGKESTGVFKAVKSELLDENGKPYAVIGKLIDISEEAAEKEQLMARMQRDGLTGLYNAETLKELVTARLASGYSNKDWQAFLLMDCDKFKAINDTFGHMEGDRVIKAIATGLRTVFDRQDLIGRVGGDEFCVFMTNIPSKEYALSKANALNTYLVGLSEKAAISVSAGIVFAKGDKSYETLFEKADIAMYKAKEMGGARVVIG